MQKTRRYALKDFPSTWQLARAHPRGRWERYIKQVGQYQTLLCLRCTALAVFSFSSKTICDFQLVWNEGKTHAQTQELQRRGRLDANISKVVHTIEHVKYGAKRGKLECGVAEACSVVVGVVG